MSKPLRMSKYYVVSSELLPEIIDKVIQAQLLLQSGKASGISEAVKEVGISRGTFYKYKDLAFSFNEHKSRKAVLSLVIQDEKGVLSEMLSMIAKENCNVLSINQTIPLNSLSVVSLTLDISELNGEVEGLCNSLKQIHQVQKVDLVAIE